jgi:hypothetical protein
LSRGVFTFAAKQNQNQRRQMPRACPGEFHDCRYLAGNVNLHGPRPWHPVYELIERGV